MLSAEKNALLTRVGAGTPMGDLIRLYWIPATVSRDLLPGGRPMRIRLLGEDLIAFRDTEGSTGIVGARCPHRGAPLAYARNEDCGLRCVYHGWKFDAAGACVDMPNEAPDTRLRASVKLLSYPTRERNGVVWVYMGPEAEPPELPMVEWNLVPEDHVFISIRVQECNWAQALEGEIDSSHAPILHGRVDAGGARTRSHWDADLSPSFELRDTDYGAMIGARRDADPGRHYWRINQFLLPFYTLVPPSNPYPDLSGHAWVPIDDETTLAFMFSYYPDRPLPEKTVNIFSQGSRGRETGHLSDHGRLDESEAEALPYGRYRPRLHRENDYGYDYSLNETYFSGLPGLWVQDAACQAGMGPTVDRSIEHLGASDAGIIRVRRNLLRAAEALRDTGERPPSADNPDAFYVRAAALLLPEGIDWVEKASHHVTAGGGLEYEIL
jgi:phenylpropionate dioxygenase-like ring-hydroxylating dioxygenase large terminal subunit